MKPVSIQPQWSANKKRKEIRQTADYLKSGVGTPHGIARASDYLHRLHRSVNDGQSQNAAHPMTAPTHAAQKEDER